MTTSPSNVFVAEMSGIHFALKVKGGFRTSMRDRIVGPSLFQQLDAEHAWATFASWNDERQRRNWT